MSTLTVLVSFSLMMFLPVALALLGSRQRGNDWDWRAAERVDQVVNRKVMSSMTDPATEAPALTPLLGDDPTVHTPGQRTAAGTGDSRVHWSRIMRQEIEALKARAAAARAEAEVYEANALAAARKAEAAAVDAMAAEAEAAVFLGRMDRAA
jgi:hypothetical protein